MGFRKGHTYTRKSVFFWYHFKGSGRKPLFPTFTTRQWPEEQYGEAAERKYVGGQWESNKL